MRRFLDDFRHALRYVAQRPLPSLIVSFSLALAIGSAATVFSYLDFLLWQKLPAGDPERLVRIVSESGNAVSHPEYEVLAAHGDTLEHLAAWAMTGSTLDTGSQTLYFYGQLVSGNYFATLAVGPQVGRLLDSEDDRRGAEPVVVLNDGLWRRHFASDPAVVGKTVLLNRHSFTVVGVAPPRFLGAGVPADLYVPLAASALLRSPEIDWLDDSKQGWLSLVGRLQPGITAQQAKGDLESLGNQQRFTADRSNRSFSVTSAATVVDPATRAELLPAARQLMIFVGLLVLLTCANVSNLLVGRTLGRLREMGVRLALGASRRQLIQRLLLESVLTAVLGALLGVLLAFWGVRFIESFLGATTAGVGGWGAGWADLHIDSRVLVFTFLVGILSGLLAGFLPALWASSRDNLGGLIKDSPGASISGKGRRFGARELLVVSQVALSMWLLAGTTLLVQSLRHLHQLRPGFETDSVLLVGLAGPNEAAAGATTRPDFQAVARRIESLPGVLAASPSWTVPLSGWSRTTPIQSLGSESEPWPVNLAIVGENYFKALKIPLLDGREFWVQDDEEHRGVAVINEALARRLWPEGNPLAQLIILPGIAGSDPNEAFEVVGLVANTRQAKVWEEPQPLLYLSLRQNFKRRVSLMVRGAGEPWALATMIRSELRQQYPDLAVVDLMTFSDHVRNALQAQYLNTRVVTALGLLGLVLSSFGVGTAMSAMVSQRKREIGIRMALGAGGDEARWLIVRRGMQLTLLGIGIGLAATLAFLKLLAGIVEGTEISPAPLPLAAAVLASLVVAFIACQVPAKRATRIDPLLAIRESP